MTHEKYLNWLRIAYERQILSDDLRRDFRRSYRGQQGEVEFDAWVKEFIGDDYLVLKNIWLTNGGSRVEVDHLLMTPNLWLVSEVKNYNGHFTYLGGDSFINDLKLDTNIVARTQSTHEVVSQIANRFDPNIQLITNLVFINQHCYVQSDYDGVVNLVMRCQLRKLLQETKLRIDRNPRYKNPSVVINYLDDYKITPSFSKPEEKDVNWINLRKGVNCPRCLGFELGISHKSFTCRQCGFKEKKTQAVKRMVNDYCSLYELECFTVDEILEFTANQISFWTIHRVVEENFDLKDGFKRKVYCFNSKR